jgi:hypothetical protein
MADSPPGSLPHCAAELASRLGARSNDAFSKVDFRQKGKLRTGATARWLSFRASQSVNLREPAFTWRAKVGPLGAVTVIDRLASGQPYGSVSLFGFLPIATGKPSRALLKGELLRYLAEIAWAPDAILANDRLLWSEIDRGKLVVSARVGEVDGHVTISLNDEGMIAQVDAADRPCQEGAEMIERPWRGVFRDFRKVAGRIVPHAADASWSVDGQYHCVWQGALTSWAPA